MCSRSHQARAWISSFPAFLLLVPCLSISRTSSQLLDSALSCLSCLNSPNMSSLLSNPASLTAAKVILSFTNTSCLHSSQPSFLQASHWGECFLHRSFSSLLLYLLVHIHSNYSNIYNAPCHSSCSIVALAKHRGRIGVMVPSPQDGM